MHTPRSRFLLILIAVALSVNAFAATFTVNSVGDAPDQAINGACDTGGTVGNDAECTLRAALQEANAAAGLDNIFFNISNGCSGNICTIELQGANKLPDIVSPVYLDGSTQPGNESVCTLPIPDRPAYRIVLDGDQVDVGPRLEDGSDGSTIRGLNVRNFYNALPIIRSNNNVLECNFIGTDETGLAPGPGNLQTGIILGCLSTGNIIGGPDPEDGNLVSANGVDGVQFYGDIPCPSEAGTPDGNFVLGNYIGVDKTGAAALGNTYSGISFFGGTGPDNNFIGLMTGGGGTSYQPNVIGANGSGVFIDAGSSGIVVAGNFIGTDVSGTVNLGNMYDGIESIGGPSNLFGGPTASDANTIAFNGDGVVVFFDSVGNRIQQNAIYSNVGIGIDLAPELWVPDGVTPNDPDDPDIGPNLLQNFPEINSIVTDGVNLEIEYHVPSVVLPLTIEFFGADSDNEEGAVFLGSHSYVAAGSAMATLPVGSIANGDYLVATATDASGNTSEFSAPVEVTEATEESVTTFIVTKDFSDNNPAEVNIHLNCSAGYPHEETAHIIDPASGTFKTIQIWQVFNYPVGALDCRIHEEPVPIAYQESYEAEALDGIAELIDNVDPGDDVGDTGCFFTNIEAGTFTCEITNTLQPSSMTVNKEWFWDEELLGTDLPRLFAQATWQCFNVRTSPSGGLVLNGPSGTLSFEGETDSEIITPIYADWGGNSYCTVVERPVDSVVESDSSDCSEVSVLLNDSPDCTIYNSVFLHAIPTLSEYGMALLALLMLGAGAMGFRRFG